MPFYYFPCKNESKFGCKSKNNAYLCSDECVSPSLKSPKSLLGEYEAQTAVHIDGLPICAYLRAFGDA